MMGPSGSGKSTLLLCAAGLLRAQSGSVCLDGVDVTRAPEKRLTALRRDRIGFVFQEFNLVPALTAEQNVGLPARFGGVRIAHGAVLDALSRVDLREKAQMRPDQLSGGQRQRVAIARALVSRPAVVFADEPTGNLDSRTTEEVLDFLRLSVDEFSQTVVMVTHERDAAERADRIISLADGRIASDEDLRGQR